MLDTWSANNDSNFAHLYLNSKMDTIDPCRKRLDLQLVFQILAKTKDRIYRNHLRLLKVAESQKHVSVCSRDLAYFL